MTHSWTKVFRPESLDRRFLVIIAVTVALIIVDTLVLKTSVLLSSQLQQEWIPISFVAESVALVICQYLIFFHIQTRSRENEKMRSNVLRAIGLAVLGVQLCISTIVALVILQIHSNSSFQTFLLTSAVILSYAVSISAIAILALRFLRWLGNDQNPLILAYTTASFVLLSNLVFTMFFSILILMDKNPIVVPHIGQSVIDIPPGSMKELLSNAYRYSSIISFVAIWAPTVLLLRYHSQRIGTVKYWIILGALLAYFLSQFLFLFFDILEPIFMISPTFVNWVLKVTFALSMPIGGVIFGIAFWFMSKSSGATTVRDYLTIAAYGSAIFFASNQAVVLVYSTFYPPFGLGTVSFVGLSSYLILLGIYSSAISISQDRRVLSEIRKSTKKELELLRSVGSAENQDRIIINVTKVAKAFQDELVSKSGIQSSLTYDELTKHIEEAVRERVKRSDKVSDERSG